VEAAVVAVHEEVKGSQIIAFFVLRDNKDHEIDELKDHLKDRVRQQIGKIATPDHIVVCPSLPKTRSGKILRRLIRKIAEGKTSHTDFGDISTLSDPETVHLLISCVKNLKK